MYGTARWILLIAAMVALGAPQTGLAIEFVTGTAAALSGNTIQVGSPGHRTVTLKLWGIEAPGRSNSNDNALYARTALDDLLYQHGQRVTCTVDSFDRDSAVCRAGDTDLGAAMLRTGWVTADRTVLLADVPGGDSERTQRAEAYRQAEAQARRERKGRWADMPAQ
jgi:endonuclease YncB( thermonuclease family)